MELSATKNNDEATYGGGFTVDLDLNTRSIAVPGSDGKTWLKMTLDKVHCIEKLIRYNDNGSIRRTRSCAENDCSKCEGGYCNLYTLTVSTEGAASDPAPASDCKYGDTLKIDRLDGRWFGTPEMAIVGNAGKLHIIFRS